MSEYPCEEELKKIVEWPHEDGYVPLMDFIQSLWQYPDYFTKQPGTCVSDKTEALYTVSTGGWSGHEDIIAAMQKNHLFWISCWVSSRRGGHYQFEIPKYLATPLVSNQIEKLKKYVHEQDIDLDDFVIELKSHEASTINNSGIDAQLDFMVESGGLPWAEAVIYDKPNEE